MNLLIIWLNENIYTKLMIISSINDLVFNVMRVCMMYSIKQFPAEVWIRCVLILKIFFTSVQSRSWGGQVWLLTKWGWNTNRNRTSYIHFLACPWHRSGHSRVCWTAASMIRMFSIICPELYCYIVYQSISTAKL